MNLLGGDEITLESTYLVFLNGMILGVIQRPEHFVQKYEIPQEEASCCTRSHSLTEGPILRFF